MSKDMFQPAVVREAAGRRILFNEIRALYRSAEKSERECVTHLIALGEKLARLKASCRHGEWLPMLADDLKIARRTASRAIRAYKDQFKLANLAHLTEPMASISAAIEPEEEVAEDGDSANETDAEPEPADEPEVPPELAHVGTPESPPSSPAAEFSRHKFWIGFNTAGEQVKVLEPILSGDEELAGWLSDFASLKKRARSIIKKAEAK